MDGIDRYPLTSPFFCVPSTNRTTRPIAYNLISICYVHVLALAASYVAAIILWLFNTM